MSDELENVLEVTPEQQTVQEQPQEQKTEQKIEKAQDDNWRQMRHRLGEIERENQELKQYLSSINKQSEQLEQEDYLDIKDDDFVEGKHVKKYVKSIQRDLQETKKALQEFNRQSAETTAEIRLKTQFSDFDSVVTKENIQALASSKPSLYRSIMANPDLYDRGFSAYEMIKNSGVIQDKYLDVDKRIEDNKNKPKSASVMNAQASESPLSRTGDYDRRVLTEERKEQLRRQVEEAKRNR